MSAGRLRGGLSRALAEKVDDQAAGLVDLIGSRTHVAIVVPRTSIAGQMRLLSRAENGEVRAAARRALSDRGIPTNAEELTGPAVMDEWNCELAVQTLARAVRDPNKLECQLDSVDEWRDCDDDQIAALYIEYKDLATRLDPIGAGAELTEQEWAAIDGAAKKGDLDLLMAFGSRKLALFTRTSAAPPAS